MKIAVLADTHMPKRAKQFPAKLLETLKEVDLILHAGDWSTLDVYEELLTYAKVEGVVGNVDHDDIHQTFDQKKILTIHGVTIGLTHGHGKGKTTEQRAIDMFQNQHVDIIIFGHSHIPTLHKYGNFVTFNPGSATDKRRQKQYSFGVINIDTKVKIEHVFYDDKS